ncbi:MAG: rod shape-determining protein MreD [Burkholderiales bacterium]|nr:rod shape-determining protein MreD [Burkholderiales bacterium]
MNARMPTPEGVIRNQVTPTLIFISLAVSFTLNLMPWQNLALMARPDFLLLVLIYWCIHEPRRVGTMSAFLLGLLVDVAESSLIGQNALVYSVCAYVALSFRLRILRFGWPLQALHIFPILLLGQGVFLLQQLILTASFPSATYLLRSALGTLLWPMLCWVLELPRRQPIRNEIE